MKKIIYITFLLLTISTFALSQSCLPNGISFTSQQEIDDFPSNYPGCTEIEGYVKIGTGSYATDISNLSGLSQLNSLGSTLEITYVPNLTSLDGLNNINSIGDLFFSTYSILNFDGLDNLTSVGGGIYIPT